MISFNSLKRIDVVWPYEGIAYMYQALPDGIRVGQDSKSISFVLRDVDGQDQNFEVVIQERNSASYLLKPDYYEEPEREYPAKLFMTDDELLLYYNGGKQTPTTGWRSPPTVTADVVGRT